MEISAKELEMKQQAEENTWNNEAKRRKVSKKAGQKGKEKFKCDICNAQFASKHGMNGHIATVHEGKKPFKCGICNASFGLKDHLSKHVATVHEGKKRFKCDICNAEFTSKHMMNVHIATIHEGRKETIQM